MAVLDLVFPKRCVGCGRLGSYFCVQCRGGMRRIETNGQYCPMCGRLAIDGATHPRCRTRYALDGLTSFFRYDGVVRKAVKTLKYRYVSDLAAEFVSIPPPLPLRGVLVPIPLHPSRLKMRGFNQAEVLGRCLSLRLQIPMRVDMLRRTRSTVPQVAMKRKEERLINMKGVFAVRHESAGVGDIVLFDDVFTTGATMREAARALKRGGVRYVWAVTMAR